MVGAKIFALLLALYGGYSFLSEPPKVPELPETWWGPGNNESVDTTIRPFKIKFSDQDIEDLRKRLNNTRTLTPALEGTGWTYGVDGTSLRKIINYWLNDYEFKKREEHLNQYPQFVTNIQGLDIHYLHVKPKQLITGKLVLPLLLQHGWPGSVVEFYKIIPMLTTPREEYDFVFEIIVPSLPGFGYSSAAVKPGLGSPQIAVVLKNLMLRLGFDKFYTQGGDWGAITTANLASLYPQHILGIHSNMCNVLSWKTTLKTILYSIAPSLLLPEDYHRMYPLKESFFRKIEETGYLHIQATKPDTVGVGPSDSPSALAAYVLEKFSTGTNPSYRFDPDGKLFEKFSPDEMIDNLMMYWIPNSMTTAMRIYAETFNRDTYSLKIESVPITVPSACAQFPHEIIHQPASFLNERYTNLLRATKMPRGGHFAALEESKLLNDDIWESIAEMERLRDASKKKTRKPNEL